MDYQDLTLKNFTVCSCNAFMCFVWIAEQTPIMSQHNIDWCS